MTVPTYTFEMIGSRRTRISIDNPEQELIFRATGSDDYNVIIQQVEASLSSFVVLNSSFLGVVTPVIQCYEIAHEGNGIWSGSAKYGKRQSDLKAAGDEAAAKIAALDGLRAANSGDMKRAG